MACKYNGAVRAIFAQCSLTVSHRYRIVGFGVKLFTNELEDDRWTYSFTLQRECTQASIKEALCHPTADELDDYVDYHRAKAAGDTPQINGPFNTGSELPLAVRDGVGRHMSNDSGYQSMKGFQLDLAQRKGFDAGGPSKVGKGKVNNIEPSKKERE